MLWLRIVNFIESGTSSVIEESESESNRNEILINLKN